MQANYFFNSEFNTMQLYSVLAKCGHTGASNKRNCYVEIEFAITANNGRDAAEKARWLPRVKHHSKSAILEVRKIDLQEYNSIKEQNKNDLFLSVTSIQEQRHLVDMTDRICYEDEEFENTNKEGHTDKKPKFHKKNVIKNPKKYSKYYHDDYEVVS